MNLFNLGKIIIGIGVFLLVAGGLLILFSRTGLLEKMPGDILIKRENFTFYFPLATSILVSIILSVLLTIVFRIMSK